MAGEKGVNTGHRRRLRSEEVPTPDDDGRSARGKLSRPRHFARRLVGRTGDGKGWPNRLAETFGQLGQGFGFDLPDAFSGETEGFANLLQRAWFAVIETEPHP